MQLQINKRAILLIFHYSVILSGLTVTVFYFKNNPSGIIKYAYIGYVLLTAYVVLRTGERLGWIKYK